MEGAFANTLHPLSYSCIALQKNNCSVATFIVCNEEQRKRCSIPVFKFFQIHSWSHTLSCWQMKAVPYSTWNWKFVSSWGKVPLVYEIECHPTSVVLASAALLCLSISVCITISPSLGVSCASSRSDNWGCYSSYYEVYCPVRCDTMWSDRHSRMFWRYVLLSSSNTEGRLSLSMWLLPDPI
jgi:hypothetical protein